MRLLLVEDDILLGDGIQAGLKQRGYAVDWVNDGDAAEAALMTMTYEAMVLDLGLPKRDGLSLLKDIRAKKNDLPVLILTARDTIADRVRGLDSGADDYLIKPFDLEELSARLRALLRRDRGRSEPVLTHGLLILDPALHVITQAGEKVDISPREFSVLETLLENKGKVVSRRRLEESLYSWDNDIGSNTVEVHIHHLRKKLGAELIRTIRGVGYVIDKMP